MKKLLFSVLLFLLSTNFANAAKTYKLDQNHTNIIWSANHFGFSSPSGKFTDVEGTIVLDEQSPSQSKVEIAIKTASIATGIEKFDNHLKSADFFNIAKFSTAKFISTEINQTAKNIAKVKGNLTLLGITKPVTLNVRLNKIGLNPISQKQTVGFSALATIKRSEFGMNFGIPGISDEVKLTIETEAVLVENANAEEQKNTEKNTNNANSWIVNNEKSKIEFKVDQDNSAVSGSFKKFSGKINFDPNKLDSSKVEFEVDTTSVDTSFASAIDTIKSAAWLASSQFPKAKFSSTNFIKLTFKDYIMSGNLTIKGKTIPVKINFSFDSNENDFRNSDLSATARGSFVIKRSDFMVGDSDITKANGVKDEVTLSFVINATK